MKHSSYIVFTSKTLLLTALCCGQAALANGGFYQDGNSSLCPLENLQMQVIEEKLLIHPMPEPVCYHLRFRGQTLNAWNLAPTSAALPLKAEEFAVVADVPTDCSPGVALRRDRLLSLWQAQAEYQVEALADQNAVLMGFPLPMWEAMYYLNPAKKRIALPAPAAANFRIFIDGKLVDNPRLAWLETPKSVDIASSKTLGFTWRASFKKGQKYTLRAEYDFGASDSADFSGQEYREGEDLPWFITPPGPKEIVSRQAISLRYYLSPLRTWGARPPARITIEVRRPPDVPSAYLVPVMPKPACVDADSLHYEYRDAYPGNELIVSIPQQWLDFNAKNWPTTPEQWRHWRKNLGESAMIACADMDNVTAPEGVTCAEQCPTETIEASIMLPRFEDFPAVERYTGPIAAPDVKSQPKARMFRTMLRKGAAGGVNFAGRYILASWGCGSGCQDSGIIDAKTGKVYFSPFIGYLSAGYPPYSVVEFNTSRDIPIYTDFRSDSRLLFTFSTSENFSFRESLLVTLLWDSRTLKPLHVAYGSIPYPYDKLPTLSYEHRYDSNYSYYLSREHEIDWMLDDGEYNGGKQARQRAAELSVALAPFHGRHDPKTARAANARGLEALQKDDLATAAQAFEEGAQADGKDIEILNNLGYVYLLQGKLKEAEEQLRATLLLDPLRVNGWVNLGQVFAAKKNSERASACFVLALRLSPKPDKTRAFLRGLVEKEPPALREALEKTLAQDWVKAIPPNSAPD